MDIICKHTENGRKRKINMYTELPQSQPTYYPHLNVEIKEECVPRDYYYEERVSLRREK
jgi:hypothetical protein